MNEAQNILNMIENVSPEAVHALDEIDELVSAYYNQESAEYEKRMGYMPKEYTRSRDALKAIRPKGLILFNILYSEKEDGTTIAWCELMFQSGKAFQSPDYIDQEEVHLPTEELAELHAIIQAIEWENNNE